MFSLTATRPRKSEVMRAFSENRNVKPAFAFWCESRWQAQQDAEAGLMVGHRLNHYHCITIRSMLVAYHAAMVFTRARSLASLSLEFNATIPATLAKPAFRCLFATWLKERTLFQFAIFSVCPLLLACRQTYPKLSTAPWLCIQSRVPHNVGNHSIFEFYHTRKKSLVHPPAMNRPAAKKNNFSWPVGNIGTNVTFESSPSLLLGGSFTF